MPPAPTLRLLIEQLIHDGKTPRQIAETAEQVGYAGEYALQVYRGLTTTASHGPCFPDRDAHHKHPKDLYEANGYGFSWWPPSLMERVYLLERSPAAGRPFWNAA